MLSLGILHNLEDYRQNVNAVSALRRCQKLPEYPPFDLPLALPSVLLTQTLPSHCLQLLAGSQMFSPLLHSKIFCRAFPPPKSPSTSTWKSQTCQAAPRLQCLGLPQHIPRETKWSSHLPSPSASSCPCPALTTLSSTRRLQGLLPH